MTPAARLQHLATSGLWAVADSNLLQAIARRDRAEFGRQGTRLRAMIGAFATLGLVYPFLWLVGMRELVRLLAQQRRGTSSAGRQASGDQPGPESYPPCFFVGFGAGPEENLYTRYLQEHAGNVGRISQIDPSTMGAWHKVGLAMAARILVRALHNARAAVASLPPEFGDWRLDFLTFVGIRVAHYAFMRAWFEDLRKYCIDLREVAFLAPDTPAFAAVDAGLPTRYLQHGMIRHSLVLPGFTWIDALTRDEAMHFRQRVPSAEIMLRPMSGSQMAPNGMARGVLIASIYGMPAEMPRVVSFIEWSLARGLRVWVRPHPREDRAFWRDEPVRTTVAIEDSDASIEEAVARLRPRLVVSWFSTALADALALGVVPVSVCASDDRDVADMVYPLFDRCLRWPDDAPTLERLLRDDRSYADVLERLRKGWSEVSS